MAVSSSSDTSSESEKSSASPPDDESPKKNKQKSRLKSPSQEPSETSEAAPVPAQRQVSKDPEQAFEDFYLKQATKEFANDIDKLRSAPDFNERNVSILIRALRQGTACFGEGERRRVGSAGL